MSKAMYRLKRPRTDIHAFMMPGFATGDTTKSYATRLGKALGVTFQEIDIKLAARQLLDDLDHPYADAERVYDVTFENVQAGLRTDTSSRWPTTAAASCSAPATCPSWRWAGAPTALATSMSTMIGTLSDRLVAMTSGEAGKVD